MPPMYPALSALLQFRLSCRKPCGQVRAGKFLSMKGQKRRGGKTGGDCQCKTEKPSQLFQPAAPSNGMNKWF